jgi:predicted O-methyltransferase YrrM
MKLNTNIPGWSSEKKLEKLAVLAGEVPYNGWIVEVGSFCGRSAYAMGMNKPNNVKLTCFDMFPDQPQEIPDTCLGDRSRPYSYQEFLRNTGEVVNLETVRAYMPLNVEYLNFSKKIDLLFIDCVHTYEAVRDDINTWHRFMAKDGIIVFDDYFDMFPGCIKAVDEFIWSVSPKSVTIEECAAWVWL